MIQYEYSDPRPRPALSCFVASSRVAPPGEGDERGESEYLTGPVSVSSNHKSAFCFSTRAPIAEHELEHHTNTSSRQFVL